MIRFQSITKQFGDGTAALNQISFTIEDGEMVVLTGPSGSGKTTIMRLLIKEYEPTDGEIIFDSIPLKEIKKKNIPLHRRKIGVVFQDYKLIPELNVWENIALPLWIAGQKQSEIESRITDLLTLVNITEKAHLFPTQLSGGEAQRVSIARALATGPNLIFADEPTGNLDKETSLAITRLLAKINEYGTTVILATHDPAVIAELKAKRAINLSHGELISDSDPDSKKPRNSKQKESEKHSEEKVTTKPDASDTKSQDEEEKSADKKTSKPDKKADVSSKEPSVDLDSSPSIESVENLDDPQEKPKKNHSESAKSNKKDNEST